MKWFQTGHSNDEYVEQRKTQFKLEGLYIILGLLALNALQGMITGNLSNHVLLSIGAILVFIIYYSLRKVFSGLEYPNVASKSRYQKKSKEVLITALTMYTIFLVVNVGEKLFFNPKREWIDIIGVSIIFLVLLFFFNYFGVKKSYEKNKEIDDYTD